MGTESGQIQLRRRVGHRQTLLECRADIQSERHKGADSENAGMGSRILSDYGHLCNNDSAFILTKLIGDKTKQIVLAHLSREANTKELAYDTFYKVCNKYMIDTSSICLKIADQFEIVGFDR